MLRPIKLAIKKLEQFLFITRVKEIFNNPELGKTKEHYELWIFTLSLALTYIFVHFVINLFPEYFLFDLDKHFILPRIIVVLVFHVITFATAISLISGFIFKILRIENATSYLGLIFLRVVYVFSLGCILLSGCVIIGLNNIFRHTSPAFSAYQFMFIIPTLILYFIMFIRMLAKPLYKITSSKSRFIGAVSVIFILLFSIKINLVVSRLFPVDFFINTPEVMNSLLQNKTARLHLKEAYSYQENSQ
jgi:hypothetical protein